MASRHERMDLGWDLLEQGEFSGALEAAEALLEEEPADPEALFLAGSALFEMGAMSEAEPILRQVLELEPDGMPARLTLGALLHETCRFDDALREVDASLEQDASEGYAHYLRGLVLDMLGRPGEADASFREAQRIDPDQFPAAVALGAEEFDAALQEALSGLPPQFADRIRNLPILVEDVPAAALLATLEVPSPDILGLFVGTPLPERSHQDLPAAPEAIYLFKRNLERSCADREELVEQIGVTLLHEIGHYLGMDEDDLDEAGYA
ncbi:MAG TPA: metallopeptidase family protein [Candidatus Polarisedimenticolia bacterium]|nr:metallopeptidase family protein [Candidatus Polarisedimenticolia bacterium]